LASALLAYWLVDKNLEQISASLLNVAYAVAAWCVILAAVTAVKRLLEQDSRPVSSGSE